MFETILSTKLHIPLLHQEMLSRGKLLGRLNDGLQPGTNLILVSAPAGFGKTTLLSEWTAKTNIPVGWVSLDKEDDEPRRFWSYVVSALQQIQPDIGKSTSTNLRSSQPLAPDQIPTALINAWDKRAEKSVLILDDYHVIDSQAIHESLDFWIDHLPPNMQLVIATRADPPLSLSRWRGRRQLLELRTADLRFTPKEITDYFNNLMGLELLSNDLEVLRVRTEGWVVGMQMAAMSMKGRDRQTLSRFIDSFSGSQRYILDYLTDEVLLQQPEEIRSFLLQTSILERLTASLCIAVTGEEYGQQMLQTLESENLFLIPLDIQRRWYRYHHLFAELLRKRLSDSHPELLPTLHLRASRWYEQHELVADALIHTLVANDTERVAQLVVGRALFMMEHTELKTLVRMLERLPDERVHSQPWLCVAKAWLLAFMGQLDRVEPLLEKAKNHQQASFETPLAAPVLAPDLEGYIAAVRALAADLTNNPQQAVQYARAALWYLPADDLITRGWAAIALTLNLYKQLELKQAEQALAEALEISKRLEANHIKVLIVCTQAALQRIKAQLRKAAESFYFALAVADEYAERAGRQLPVSGYAHVYLASILLEWNQLASALKSAQRGIELCKQWGEPQLLASGYVFLGEVYLAIGDHDGAISAMELAEQTAGSISAWYASCFHHYKILALFKKGLYEPVFDWADSLSTGWADSFPVNVRWNGQLILARVKIAQGRRKEALDILKLVQAETEQAGELKFVIAARVLQALAWGEDDPSDQALATLSLALSLAKPEGFIRTFIEEGSRMEKLLMAAVAHGIHVDYSAALLTALRQEQEHEQPIATGEFEPLSEREMEVLRLLTTRLTRAEIARQLFITRNTLGTHIKNIYRKLNVNSREGAIERGKELQLL